MWLLGYHERLCERAEGPARVNLPNCNFLPLPKFNVALLIVSTQVVTIQSTPFVDHVLKPPGGRCNTSNRVEDLKFQVECTHTNATTGASACSVHNSMLSSLSAICSRLEWVFGRRDDFLANCDFLNCSNHSDGARSVGNQKGESS